MRLPRNVRRLVMIEVQVSSSSQEMPAVSCGVDRHLANLRNRIHRLRGKRSHRIQFGETLPRKANGERSTVKARRNRQAVGMQMIIAFFQELLVQLLMALGQKT
jgi:hypothetical protein